MFFFPTKLPSLCPSCMSPKVKPVSHLSFFLIKFITWCSDPGLCHPQQLWLRFIPGVPDNAIDSVPCELVWIQSYPTLSPTLPPGTQGDKLQPSCIDCLHIPFLLTGQLLHRCLSQGSYCSFPLQKATQETPLALTGFCYGLNAYIPPKSIPSKIPTPNTQS